MLCIRLLRTTYYGNYCKCWTLRGRGQASQKRTQIHPHTRARVTGKEERKNSARRRELSKEVVRRKEIVHPWLHSRSRPLT